MRQSDIKRRIVQRGVEQRECQQEQTTADDVAAGLLLELKRAVGGMRDGQDDEAGDTESDTQDELPVSDTTDETETVISPEPQDTPAEHPEPHPPIPQAAERPHI